MAPQIWNPDKTLNTNAFDNNDMFCVGVAVSRGNARCRWRITGDRHNKVCSILDEMGTRPPTEISGSKLLSRLAKLGLCEEQHRHQVRDILDRWEEVIEDVVKQYEEMEKLKRRNRQLKIRLAEECEEREQLAAQLGELNAEFASSCGASAIEASAQNRNEFEARESDLLLQVKDLKRSVAESRGHAQRLAVEEAELSRRLGDERRVSAQRQHDHDLSAEKVDDLQSQLCEHRQMSEHLTRDLEKATTDRKGLLAQTNSLRVQSAIKSQSLNQVKRNLEEAKITQATLLEEKEKLQSLLATECQTSGQLEKKLASREVELVSVQGTLERTQLDLTQSRKVNEEQAAADAASREATTAGTTRLLERIRQLEEQSRFSFLSAFIGRINGLARHIALWATGGGRLKARERDGSRYGVNPRVFLLSSTS
jgi:chromosome segregation ATPase